MGNAIWNERSSDKKWTKSKTIHGNIIFAALITIITQGFGIELSAPLIAILQAGFNIILRKLTKGAIKF